MDHASISESVKAYAQKIKFECLIRHHESSGASVEEAKEAYGADETRLVKCLLFTHKNGFIGAIVRGCDRVSVKALEQASNQQDLRMAKAKEVKQVLGIEVGGVHALIFHEKNIPAFVDSQVFEAKTVVGSAGTPYDSLTFPPWQLVDLLKYTLAPITEDEPLP